MKRINYINWAIDYRNVIRFFHYDPTKWLIRMMNFFGLASDLKTAPQQKITQYRLEASIK